MAYKKRLFLFAGYIRDSYMDDSLIYHVTALSKHGDVIVCLDNDLKKSELNKLKNVTIFAMANRHGEYDFGSYKRDFIYAKENELLKKYDYVYLVNDSVFGPLFDITKTLDNIESKNSDAAGLIVATHKTHSYMESWFIRLNKNIFNSDWFDKFICGVEKQPTKSRVTIKYEHGLSNLIHEKNYSWDGVYTYHGRFTYNKPKYLFKHGCPFIKKACFTRHNGGLGKQIKYVLNHCQMNVQLPIIKTANKLYGTNYMNWLMTDNIIKILVRKLSYAIKKLKNGKI